MHNKLTAIQRVDRLRERLKSGANPTDEPLLKKLENCGVGWKGRYLCRTPACFRCRSINIRKQERDSASLLGHFANEDLAWVTVVLGGTSNIDGLTRLIGKSRQDTRNCFVSARRRDPRWHGTYLRAWHEIDAVGAQHMPILPPERRSLIPSLVPMASDTLLPTWLPTWHGLMFRNGLSLSEIKCQFSRQWKSDYQVDVKPLSMGQDVAANLTKLTSYANKFHTTVSLDGDVRDPWPLSWETKFFGWIDASHRNPFESLRMTIHQFVHEHEHDVCKAVKEMCPLPFSYSFTGVPMYNNTGRLYW